MNELEELEESLRFWFKEKLNLSRLSFRYQNKQLAQGGDIVVKIIDSEPLQKDATTPAPVESLIEESAKWTLPVNNVKLSDITASLFLKREVAYCIFITKCCTRNGFSSTSYADQQIVLNCDVDETNSDNLNMTDFRILSVRNVVRNLLEFEGYSTASEDLLKESAVTVNISRRRSPGKPKSVDLLCGAVITSGIKASEYVNKRANDMQLIAQHKYGIRVKDHQRFQQTIASLGRSAATVDVLESKPSSPIDMKKEKNQSSKGASFILYNYARLSVLFKTFAEKQKTGYYPALPEINMIDFGLLKEEDEWQLFWIYVAGFPSTIKQALGDGDWQRLSPHVVLNFASGLVICLSKYYRRVRILTENREHMLPTMFARIYLLKSVFYVLSTLLKLLNLEAITQM